MFNRIYMRFSRSVMGVAGSSQLCALAVGLSVSSTMADTLIVSKGGGAGTFPTIQSAIDAIPGVPSDVIIVEPGDYNESLDFGGKSFTLRASNPAAEFGAKRTTLRSASLGQMVFVPLGAGSITSIIGFFFEDHLSVVDQRGSIVVQDAIMTLDRCTFTNNTSRGVQGATVRGYRANLTVKDCVFEGNEGDSTGAVSNFGSTSSTGVMPSLTVVNSRFSLNRATGETFTADAGAISSTVPTTIAHSSFDRNFSADSSGAVSIFFATATLFGNVFTGNVCDTDASYLLVLGGDVDLINCTAAYSFFGEFEPDGAEAGLVYRDSGTATGLRIKNSILWRNRAIGSVRPEVISDAASPSRVEVVSSLIDGGAPANTRVVGRAVLDADPLFELDGFLPPTDLDELRPGPGSPAIDAGDDFLLPRAFEVGLEGFGIVQTDIRGLDRVADDRFVGGSPDLYMYRPELARGAFADPNRGPQIFDVGAGSSLSTFLAIPRAAYPRRLVLDTLIDHPEVTQLTASLATEDLNFPRFAFNRPACGGAASVAMTAYDGSSGGFPCGLNQFLGFPYSPLDSFRFDFTVARTLELDVADFVVGQSGNLDNWTVTLTDSAVDLGAYEQPGSPSILPIGPPTTSDTRQRFRAVFDRPVFRRDNFGFPATFDLERLPPAGAGAGPVTPIGRKTVDITATAGLRLPGDSRFPRTAPNPAFDLRSDFTLEAWIRPDTVVGGTQHIISTRTKNENVGARLGVSDGGRLIFTKFGIVNVTTIGAYINAETWTHVAARLSGANSVTFFVNGRPVETLSASGADLIGSGLGVFIGGDFFSDPFKGDIDEVRVWDEPCPDHAIFANAHRRLSGLEEGLIGYWRLDGAEDLGTGDPGVNDVRDHSLTGAHADIADATFVEGRPLQEGMTFYRDLSSRVTIPHRQDYDVPASFTVEAWVRATDVVTGTRSRIVASIGPGGFGFGRSETGTVMFTTFGVRDYFFAANPFVQNQWVHLAVVLDEAFDASLYVNGGFVQKINHSSGALPFTSDLFIGRSQGEPWQGDIAEVRYWNVARSAAEISASYDAPVPNVSTGLIGYWPLDGFEDLGAGAPGKNDLVDLSPLSNHGDAQNVHEGFTDEFFVTTQVGYGAEAAPFAIRWNDASPGIAATLGVTLFIDSGHVTFVPQGCAADIAGSAGGAALSATPDGATDAFDLLFFLSELAGEAPRTDISPEDPDGLFDQNDALAFLAVLLTGCP